MTGSQALVLGGFCMADFVPIPALLDSQSLEGTCQTDGKKPRRLMPAGMAMHFVLPGGEKMPVPARRKVKLARDKRGFTSQ
ncbi:MAG: hypothetical protein ACM3SV_05230 [Betaproteobacteria bacterium]